MLLTSPRGLPHLLDRIAEDAALLLNAERASIFLLDESRSELWSQVALGSDEVLRFDARLGIAGAVVLGAEPLLVADVAQDDRFYAGMDARTGFHTRNIVAAPLIVPSGECIGAFEVLNKRTGTFTESDTELLQALARNAARSIGDTLLLQELQSRNERLRHEAVRRFSTETLLGTNPRIRAIVQLIEQIRDTDVNVLITGETGTGKELIARAIHGSSARRERPFVALNCAALPDDLLEAELFGIEKGVATGVDARAGRFEQADGGTLFLDEIGDLSDAAQAKILRALQERVVDRVGGKNSISVNVRLLSATHHDLVKEAESGRFRRDLFYRLKVVHIETPPLRELLDDIPRLAKRILTAKCAELGREPKRLSTEALGQLTAYHWPGNVRELANEMTRLAASVRREEIRPEDLAPALRGRAANGTHDMKRAVADLERRMIAEALRACGGNKAQAAKRLGLSRQGLLNKLRRYEA